jgi:hypothetical protein
MYQRLQPRLKPPEDARRSPRLTFSGTCRSIFTMLRSVACTCGFSRGSCVAKPKAAAKAAGTFQSAVHRRSHTVSSGAASVFRTKRGERRASSDGCT